MNRDMDAVLGHRSWIVINLSTLKNNLNVYNASIPSNLQIMAVVKADAYGHGDKLVAKYLSDYEINHFAVSNIDEAIHIREAGAKGQILILGYTPVERAGDLEKYDITQALLSEDYAEKLASQRVPINVSLLLILGCGV